LPVCDRVKLASSSHFILQRLCQVKCNKGKNHAIPPGMVLSIVTRGSGASYPMKTLVAKIVAENSSFQDEHSGATIASEVEWALRELGGEVSYTGRKATITFRLEIRSQGEGSFSFVYPGMIFAIYISTTIPG